MTECYTSKFLNYFNCNCTFSGGGSVVDIPLFIVALTVGLRFVFDP